MRNQNTKPHAIVTGILCRSAASFTRFLGTRAESLLAALRRVRLQSDQSNLSDLSDLSDKIAAPPPDRVLAFRLTAARYHG
ncbi:hypothetical protein FJY63_11595 [Candidatus Sumerlaeota bacterium]|nr:hypothetical protein [Candidatus Sumerlaeota bacterium]